MKFLLRFSNLLYLHQIANGLSKLEIVCIYDVQFNNLSNRKSDVYMPWTKNNNYTIIGKYRLIVPKKVSLR